MADFKKSIQKHFPASRTTIVTDESSTTYVTDESSTTNVTDKSSKTNVMDESVGLVSEKKIQPLNCQDLKGLRRKGRGIIIILLVIAVIGTAIAISVWKSQSGNQSVPNCDQKSYPTEIAINASLKNESYKRSTDYNVFVNRKVLRDVINETKNNCIGENRNLTVTYLVEVPPEKNVYDYRGGVTVTLNSTFMNSTCELTYPPEMGGYAANDTKYKVKPDECQLLLSRTFPDPRRIEFAAKVPIDPENDSDFSLNVTLTIIHKDVFTLVNFSATLST